MNYNDSELAALESGSHRIGVFFRLATDPLVRLWLGFGDIEPGVNAYDSAGATYRGFGEIQNIPTFKQLLNGAAERVAFTLSGVSGDVLSTAPGEVRKVRGRRADVGFALMDGNWALLGPVHWRARYIADVLSIEQQRQAGASDPVVRVLTLSCGSRFTGRRRPSYSYYSDQDQQARFPDDKFCSLVGDYAHGYNKQWPTF